MTAYPVMRWPSAWMGLPGFLVTAVFLNVALTNSACAGPISLYDALVDQEFTFSLSNGVTAVDGGSGITTNTHSGSGQTSSTVQATPTLILFLHAFGSGTGSSEIAGTATVEFDSLASSYEVDLLRTTGTTTHTSSPAPGGTASANATFSITGDNATMLSSCSNPSAFECFLVHDNGTITFAGDAQGSAFTPVSTAPEPLSLSLVGLGLAVLGFSRLRKLK